MNRLLKSPSSFKTLQIARPAPTPNPSLSTQENLIKMVTADPFQALIHKSFYKSINQENRLTIYSKTLASETLQCQDKKDQKESSLATEKDYKKNENTHIKKLNFEPENVNFSIYQIENENLQKFNPFGKKAKPSTSQEEKEDANQPGSGPPPKFDHFKEISNLIKKSQTTSVFPHGLGQIDERLLNYIDEKVTVQVNLHLRDFYENKDRLVDGAQSTLDDSLLPDSIKNDKERMDRRKKIKQRKSDGSNLSERMLADLLKKIDPTGTMSSLNPHSGHYYKNLKIKGKDNALKEYKAACNYVTLCFPIGTLTLESHNANAESQLVNSKLRWMNQDPVINMNFKIYTYFTIKQKRIVKIEITDVQKSKSAAEKAKDALKGLGAKATAPPAGK